MRDEVRAWAATLDDDARARWLTLLDALDWERARADRAEADAAAMRAALDPLLDDYCDLHDNDTKHEMFGDPAQAALDGTAGRALLDEVAALRARVAEMERERDTARTYLAGQRAAWRSIVQSEAERAAGRMSVPARRLTPREWLRDLDHACEAAGVTDADEARGRGET